MIPRYRTEQAQLELPFQPGPIAPLTGERRRATLSALAQLLLSAAGAGPGETDDEC